MAGRYACLVVGPRAEGVTPLIRCQVATGELAGDFDRTFWPGIPAGDGPVERSDQHGVAVGEVSRVRDELRWRRYDRAERCPCPAVPERDLAVSACGDKRGAVGRVR